MKSAIALASVAVVVLLLLLAVFRGLRFFEALRGPEGGTADRAAEEIDRLEEERRRLLGHLREIRFDHETGKLGDVDHHELERRVGQRAVEVMQALDAARTAQAPAFVTTAASDPGEDGDR